MAWCSRVCALCCAVLGMLVAQPALSGGSATPPPAPIWSGVYVGAHGGYGWGNVSYTLDLFAGPEHFSHDLGGWFGGGHVGLQRQWGHLVAGVEVAYSALNLSDTVESKLLPGRFRQIDIDSLVTVTARLGYARDRWLAYVKGGYASADVDTTVYTNPAGPVSKTSGREQGWTIGAGLELLCSHRFVLGVEYDYVHLDIGDRDGLLPDYKRFTYSDSDDKIHTVVARLSYKFGAEPAHVPLK
jgi:outer membrane immunogenic protein